MIGAVEELNIALDEKVVCEKKLIEALEELVVASQEASPEELAGYDLDDIFMETFEKIQESNFEKYIVLLHDLVLYMRDPRNIYSFIAPHFVPESRFSIEVASLIFSTGKNFYIETDGFFHSLLKCIIPENIEESPDRKLFLLLAMIGDKSVALSIVKPFVKKLCHISLKTSTANCYKILWIVLWIMRYHPMSYSMATKSSFRKDLEWSTVITMDRFQPYLFELDILGESLCEIKEIVGMIKSEAADVKKRPKLITLENFFFPQLKM